MSNLEADKEAFARVLKALRPYLGDLVFVGGWAHRLYTIHELARSPGFEPLMTEDADIATSVRLAKKTESILELLKNEGFNETFSGEDTPPVSEYRLGEEEGGFYVEFLAPLTGSGYKRDGRRDATATIAGVTAQKLRHVDILIMDPWRIRLSDANGFPLGADGLDVQIANPVSYLVQKLLIFPDRKPDKQAKDILYIHDTLLMFTQAFDQLHECWVKLGARLPVDHRHCRRVRHSWSTEHSTRIGALFCCNEA